MTTWIKEITELAETIVSMRYGDLLEVARQLVAMNAEGEREVDTKHGMADTLFDWAQATVEEAKIDAEAIAKEQAKAA